MPTQDERPTCPRCSASFSKKSSLVRHSKRCLRGVKAPTRRRSCQQCSDAKARCDLRRPLCGRCRIRGLGCEFPTDQEDEDSAISLSPGRDDPVEALQPEQGREDSSSSTVPVRISSWNENSSTTSQDPGLNQALDPSVSLTATAGHASGLQASCPVPDETPGHTWPAKLPPMLILCNERRKTLLGPSPSTPVSEAVAKHTVHFITRVLKSWPAMMAMHYTAHLPPMIHPLQLDSAMPQSLANCYTLTKMWYGHTEGSRELIRNTILQEVRRLFREYRSYGEIDLLAATQSILILLIILLFGMGQTTEDKYHEEAHLLVQAWDIKRALAATRLFLPEEPTRRRPPWRSWAQTNAKSRTVQALHHLEWAWSILRGYPLLTCFELGLVPAPAAAYLWQETDEEKWKKLYQESRHIWKDGDYKIGELLHIEAGKDLDTRSEMWLAEADEFGMMLMAEGKVPLFADALNVRADTKLEVNATDVQ